VPDIAEFLRVRDYAKGQLHEAVRLLVEQIRRRRWKCVEHGELERGDYSGEEPPTCRRFLDDTKDRCGATCVPGEPVLAADRMQVAVGKLSDLCLMSEELARELGLTKAAKVEQHLHLTQNIVQMPLTREELESLPDPIRDKLLLWNSQLRLATTAVGK
jgi:hypothetical protein